MWVKLVNAIRLLWAHRSSCLSDKNMLEIPVV